MSEFNITAGFGFIFPNKERISDKSPSMRGRFKTPSGNEYKISMWYKKSGHYNCVIVAEEEEYIEEEKLMFYD